MPAIEAAATNAADSKADAADVVSSSGTISASAASQSSMAAASGGQAGNDGIAKAREREDAMRKNHGNHGFG